MLIAMYSIWRCRLSGHQVRRLASVPLCHEYRPLSEMRIQAKWRACRLKNTCATINTRRPFTGHAMPLITSPLAPTRSRFPRAGPPECKIATYDAPRRCPIPPPLRSRASRSALASAAATTHNTLQTGAHHP